MTIDPSRPGPAGEDRAGSGLGRVLGRLRRAGPPERMRILTIGGRAIRVSVREGTPGRPPLLLCNGIGASLELFQPFVDALDPQRPVIRFDMPGIGGSPAAVVPYHLATLPSLLAGLLDQLGYEQADVLGISWGGGLAQQFALSRPDRVRRLVLVATGPGALMVPGHPRVLLRMLTPRRHRDPGLRGPHRRRAVRGQRAGRPGRGPGPAARHDTPGPARGYYYQLISSLGWTSLPRLPRLRPPTLILAGDDDPIIPVVNARIMHRLIPRSSCTSTTAATSSWPPTPNAWRRGGGVPRCRPHRGGEPAMTQVTSAHLGESLGTDFFSVREQFTDEQWEHFITVRRFVDEEVVPVVGPYWERAEICWPLVKRLPELGIVGEDIKGYGCAGMSPMACGLVTMELHRGDGSLGVFLGVHAGLAMNSIAMCGSEEQKARWLPAMAPWTSWGPSR